jgi:hypothetical protein
MLAVGAAAWAWYAGEAYLRRYASDISARTPGDRSGKIHIELVNAPPWMEHGSLLRQEIVARVAQQLSSDPLGATDLDRAVHALRGSAWISAVDRIERVAVDQVRVHARYRVPAALVATKEGYHLVDTQGVRLLAQPYAPGQRPPGNLPVIAGAKNTRCAVGEVWAGEDVQGALKVIQLLETRPYYEQVAAVNVHKRDSLGRVRIEIEASNGGRIDWGFPPGEQHIMEPSAQLKLAGIDEFYRMYNVIAAPDKVVEVFNDVVMVRMIE